MAFINRITRAEALEKVAEITAKQDIIYDKFVSSDMNVHMYEKENERLSSDKEMLSSLLEGDDIVAL